MWQGCLKVCVLLVVCAFLGLLILSVTLIGFGFYGVPLAISGSILALSSPHYRDWLTSQNGYKKRLARLPGLRGDSAKVLAIATLIYLLPISWLGVISLDQILEKVGTTLTAAIMGLIGMGLLYGWCIKGWRLPATERQETSRLSIRAVIGDVKNSGAARNWLVAGLALPVLWLGGIIGLATFNEPLREAGLLAAFTATPTPTHTATPTATTTTNTPLPTRTPVSTNTPTSTNTPISTNAPIPTDTPIPAPTSSAPSVAVEKTVNLRSGPGTDYKVVGTLPIKQNFEIIGRNADSSWWQIKVKNEPAWVAASVVKAANLDQEIEVVEVAPPPPTPTSILTQTPTAVPASTPLPVSIPTQPPQPVAVCGCSSDSYNCSDGGAVACFHYCQSIGAGDPHRLDRDNDGAACESN